MKKIKAGDIVIVQYSHERATVVKMIDDDLMLAEVRGVVFPLFCTLVESHYAQREKPSEPSAPPTGGHIIKETRKSTGVHLRVEPLFTLDEFNDEVIDKLRLSVVNQTEDSLRFFYELDYAGAVDYELENSVGPFQELFLQEISFATVNDSPSCHFEFSLSVPDKKRVGYYETATKFHGKQLFQKIEKNRGKKDAYVDYLLFARYPDKEKAVGLPSSASRLKENKNFRIYDLSTIKEHLLPARSVIDLHLEKLTDEWQKLSGSESLQLQIREFEKWYRAAIDNRQPDLTVIHGIGSGKLRDEIHSLLKNRAEVKSFVNQYDPRFGYGATRIFFQY